MLRLQLATYALLLLGCCDALPLDSSAAAPQPNLHSLAPDAAEPPLDSGSFTLSYDGSTAHDIAAQQPSGQAPAPDAQPKDVSSTLSYDDNIARYSAAAPQPRQQKSEPNAAAQTDDSGSFMYEVSDDMAHDTPDLFGSWSGPTRRDFRCHACGRAPVVLESRSQTNRLLCTRVHSIADYERIAEPIIDLYWSISDQDSPNSSPRGSFVACLLRTARHDFMDFRVGAGRGGSDGCVNLADKDNDGISRCACAASHGVMEPSDEP